MTPTPSITRKLTTILSADAANYSGRMALDEVGTVQALRAARRVIDAHITMRGGRIANTSGDGLIAEFPSVVEATAAAVNIQRDLMGSADSLPFRLGLHLGDVIVEGEDLLGDGVNLAARLQEMAPEGGIFVSRQIFDHASGRLDARFRPMGPASAKHLPDDISVYAIEAHGINAPDDLDAVLPRITPKAAQPPKTKPRRKRRKFRQVLLVMVALFAALDLVTGEGLTWFYFPVMPIAAIYVLSHLWDRQET